MRAQEGICPLKSVVDSWFMVEFLVTIDYELVSVQWKGGRIFALCILGEDVMNVGCSKVVLHISVSAQF